MGVLIGEANVTRFSYLEYQALMLCLAALICMGLLAIELTMNRFQVLPLLFPGMFTIRERRFYFFDFDASNPVVAGRLRTQAKMLARMTLCVVLSYLWQHCVMDTTQQVGTEFPRQQCDDGSDCFASELHFMTLLRRQHTPVDCKGTQHDFPSRVVVSCIRFVQPSASKWLMHLAIAHSVTQLNLKSYELLVWVAGNSRRTRCFFGFVIFASFSICLGLFFAGLMSEFASSWLSFVTILSVPVFFWNVHQSAKMLEMLWKEESAQMQVQIEQHLASALADLEPGKEHEEIEVQGHGLGAVVTMRARSLLKLSGMSGIQSLLVPRGRWQHNGIDTSNESTTSSIQLSPRVRPHSGPSGGLEAPPQMPGPPEEEMAPTGPPASPRFHRLGPSARRLAAG